ncbi:unnamed protein product, partial [Polarella glacialis]
GGRPPPELRGLKEAVAAGRAQGFQSLADAQQLRERLAAGVTSVAIVGAGYVGVELASALAEALPGAAASGDIVLFGGEFMRGAEDANVRRCTERLEDLGVVQRRGRVTSLEDSGLSWSPTPDDKPQSHMCDLVIVTGPLAAAIQFPGLIPPSPIGSASEEAALAGRAVTDPFLRAAPGVFCLGDAASAGTPPTGQAAMQQADVAAWNIFTQLSKLPRLTWRQYKPSALGEFVSLGRSDAAGVVQPAQLGKLLPPALPPALAKAVSKLLDSGNVDLVGNVDLGGAPAALLRRLAYLYRMPTIGHRLRVAQQWLERGGGVLPVFVANIVYKHLLLHGAPGTGKTLFARTLAGQTVRLSALLTDAAGAATTSDGRPRSTIVVRHKAKSERWTKVLDGDQVEVEVDTRDERQRMLGMFMNEHIHKPTKKGKVIEVDSGLDDNFMAEVAKKTEGFSGRQLAKLVLAYQAAVFGSGTTRLTPGLAETVLNYKLVHREEDAHRAASNSKDDYA